MVLVLTALPDAPGIRPVSGHEGRGEQGRHWLVKQEVLLRWGGAGMDRTKRGTGFENTDRNEVCMNMKSLGQTGK